MKLEAVPKMLSMIPAVLKGVTPGDLDKIKAIVRATFPSVRQISIESVALQMEDTAARPLLIDVRPPAEFAVSHLRGALNLRTLDQISHAMKATGPAETILYCSVGYRSSKLAQQLGKETGLAAASLEGSIFQWANESRPLFQGDRPTRSVHPYSEKWAGLLNPGLASLVPQPL